MVDYLLNPALARTELEKASGDAKISDNAVGDRTGCWNTAARPWTDSGTCRVRQEKPSSQGKSRRPLNRVPKGLRQGPT